LREIDPLLAVDLR